MKADLTKEVTVFVIAVEKEKNYQQCLDNLHNQDCTFMINVIDSIAPMDKAYNEMINRCNTKYFIQCDEDMLLNDNAVSYLYNKMINANSKVAIIASPLWDTHLERTIMGVKIYNHEIIKNYPFTDSYSCEISQFTKFTWNGYKIVTDWQPENEYEKSAYIGRHGENYTNFTAYERYYRLMRKQVMLGQMAWIEEWFQGFQTRYKEKKNEIDLFSFLGLVVGFLSAKKETGEKDFTKYNQIEGYDKLSQVANKIDITDEIELILNRISLIVFGKEIEPKKINELLAFFGYPLELCIHVTSKCNLSCWHCKRNSVVNIHDMNSDTVLVALDKFPSIQRICIAGFGETLLCDNLESIIKCINKRGKSIGLITNGIKILTEYNKKLLTENKIDYISVSLHDINDNNVLEGIKFLVSKGVNVGISYIISKDNYKMIPTIIGLGNNLNVNFIHFLNVLPYTPNFKNLVITDKDIDILDRIEIYKKLDVNNIVKLYPIPISHTNNPLRCKSPFISISMDAAGWIGGCRRLVEPYGLSFIKFQHPFHRNAFNILRRQLLTGESLTANCKNCWGNWYE